MKKNLLITVCILTVSLPSCAQWNWNKIKKQAEDTYEEHTGGSKSSLSNQEVVSGLKEALTVGSKNSATKASAVDGYWKDPKIRIPFPPEAQKVKNTVEDLGMKKQVEKFELTMNRAAEEAAKEAAPIFISTVKGMTISDGFKILKGADNAATEYLMQKTSAQLTTKFTPVVKRAIDKVKLTQHWNPVITTYNRVPGVTKMNPDLEAYITERAIKGLFVLVAAEELKIRKDPMARISAILKKVFGSLD